jgi:hypothetical protein
MDVKIKVGTREIAFSIGITAILCIIMAVVGFAITGTLQGGAVGFVLPILAYVSALFAVVPFAGIWLYDIVYNLLINWLLGATGLSATFAIPQLVFFWLYLISAVFICVIMSFVAAVFIVGLIAAVASR